MDEVRDWLRERLPTHSVPEHLLLLPGVPLSGNGKVDRRAIREIFERHSNEPIDAYEPPAGELESRVACVWEQILGARRIGRNQTFFALGGDSLSATRLVEAIRESLSVELTLRRLFSAPTVAGVAALIAEQCPVLDRQEVFEEGVL
jgi:acyl carrier protein